MTHVFISYTRRNDFDRQFATKLREWLIQRNFQPWMDIYDIPDGAHWDNTIDDALEHSDYVVGLISPDSVGSDNVKNEWAWALERGKLRLLLIRPTEDIPHRFIRVDYIDFTTAYGEAWNRLFGALSSEFEAEISTPSRKPKRRPPPRPRSQNSSSSSWVRTAVIILIIAAVICVGSSMVLDELAFMGWYMW